MTSRSIEEVIGGRFQHTLSNLTGAVEEITRLLSEDTLWAYNNIEKAEVEVALLGMMFQLRENTSKMERLKKKVEDRYVPSQEVTEKEEEGYEKGMLWAHDYYPGGPFKLGTTKYPEDPIYTQKVKESDREFHAWHKGFQEGIEHRKNLGVPSTIKNYDSAKQKLKYP